MTNKEIKDFTSKLVSLKNENSINKITIRTYERNILELEAFEGLIINTLDNPNLTPSEMIEIIKNNL
jgi:hypothetical protein